MKKIIYTLSIGLLAACSSVKTTPDTIRNEEVGFQVVERHPETIPSWAKDFFAFRKESSSPDTIYYFGESGDVSDRISGCEVADLDAKKKIAQQIATLVSGKIGSYKGGQLFVNKNDPNDYSLKQHTETVLASKSLAIIQGVRQEGIYWEERNYAKSGGKMSVYTCMVLASISARDLDAALQSTARKAPSAIEDPEAKKVVEENLASLEKEFNSYFSKN